MSTWHPIETAPKDGTEIVIATRGWPVYPPARWGEIDAGVSGWLFSDESLTIGIDDGVLGWNEDIEEGYMPTHWMPLPKALR